MTNELTAAFRAQVILAASRNRLSTSELLRACFAVAIARVQENGLGRKDLHTVLDETILASETDLPGVLDAVAAVRAAIRERQL